MNPFKRTCSSLQLDAAARAVGQGALRALSPSDRRSAIAGVAGFVLRLFRRQDALESPAKSPGRIRPASLKVPASVPEGSGQRPRRLRSAAATGRTPAPPRGGRRSDRRPATSNQQPLTRRSAA